MTFEEEWTSLVRRQEGADSTGMRLNEAGGGSYGSYAPDLVVRDDELGKIGNQAASLFRQIQKKADEAREETSTAANDLTGQDLAMGAALLAVHDAWNTQTGTVKEACAHISNHLDYTGKLHDRDEDKIRTSMRDAGGHLMTPSRIRDHID